MTDAYLEDVPGVKDVRLRGGSLLPRRNIIEIDGAVVADDAVGAQTRVTLRMPFALQQVNIADHPEQTASAFIADNADADAYRFVGVTGLHGLGVPRTGGRNRVWIINASASAAMDVTHQDAGAPATSRFVTTTAGTVAIAAGAMYLAAYYGDRWHLVG